MGKMRPMLAGLLLGTLLGCATQEDQEPYVTDNLNAATTMQQVSYTVQPGDTLDSIARSRNCSPALLVSINNLEGQPIKPGDILQVPAH